MSPVQKNALGIAGITALGIGAFILIAPYTFYASYGIALDPNPSLLSELRAPGACLAVFEAVMLAGIATPALWQAAVVVALVLELVIASPCLFAFRRGAGASISGLVAR